MTLVQLLEQCVASGAGWQLSGGIGANGVPFATALVGVKDERNPDAKHIHSIKTRSGVPVPAAEALEEALTELMGKMLMAKIGAGNADR